MLGHADNDGVGGVGEFLSIMKPASSWCIIEGCWSTTIFGVASIKGGEARGVITRPWCG